MTGPDGSARESAAARATAAQPAAARLLVLGSANRDLTVAVERLPRPGETLLGGTLASGPGGKGANQAASAARAGGHPVFIGAVGNDPAGDDMADDLAHAGVDVTHLGRVDRPTGVALITVAGDGENTIVVAPGANQALDRQTVSAAVAALASPGGVLLAQLEVPLDVVAAAARVAVDAGARFALNLSPFRAVGAELLALCDPLVVNETEAAALLGRDSLLGGAADARADQSGDAPDADTLADAAADAVVELAARARSAVITLGGAGAVWSDGRVTARVPSRPVTVVDTTGAGDAFVGALCAALVRGSELGAAVEAGVVAGGEAVQYHGAQPPREG
ncbi:ribokinase [Galbitalea soli]|uniref:Ribokinase n=1 Tax=Galbitalea soli TaxID=1268042 RepID=A0A7C9TRG1_9MICO|nr:ribokinase [Galbitalea soli]NEM91282.1 ribokinase [Galbitalea soli]NYJ29971.1 ribokinase [Galbitalea soli]